MKLLGRKHAGIWLMGKNNKHLITSLTLRFFVLWISSNDKFDNLSSPIVALRQFSTRRIALNERSLDTSIFDSFRMDIGDRQAFLDEVARWKTRWNMVDGQKQQTLLETLNEIVFYFMSKQNL
jgi:hypothetical protein